MSLCTVAKLALPTRSELLESSSMIMQHCGVATSAAACPEGVALYADLNSLMHCDDCRHCTSWCQLV
jgi:hypothetical protein